MNLPTRAWQVGAKMIRRSAIFLCIVDHGYKELLDDSLLALFKIVDHSVLYTESLSVLLPSALDVMFEIGDERLKDIGFEILQAFYQNKNVVQSKKIVVLNYAEVIRNADFCFSGKKRQSHVTGDPSNLEMLFLELSSSADSKTD